MPTMNQSMKSLLSTIPPEALDLNRDLDAIVKMGFKRQNNCLFLRSCLELKTNVTKNDFPDQTGYECFINSINIDDFVDGDFLMQGLLLSQGIFRIFRDMEEKGELNSILMIDDVAAKIKFHIIRENEKWLLDNLDEYEEAIFVSNSSEYIDVKSFRGR